MMLRRVLLPLLVACSGADTTELESIDTPMRATPGAEAPPPRSASAELRDPRGSFAPGTTQHSGDTSLPASATSSDTRLPGPDSRTTERPVSSTPSDSSTPSVPAAAPDAGAPAPAPLPCTLRLEWNTLELSNAECQALSAVPEATLAVWDGTQLRLLGSDWTVEDDRLERTRRCRHSSGQLWRFAEHVALAAPLPTDHCPATAIEASYAYDECPLLSPGTVCAPDEPSACQLRAMLRLTPLDGDPDPEALREALARPELEQSCRPVGSDPRQPSSEGERCFDGECAAGLFCSRELGGSCAALGEGTCTPAPTSAECSGTSQTLCLCSDPPLPLEQLPPFDPSLPDALPTNTCFAHALGLSVIECPPG